MASHALFVESGPRQRKTMAHVLDLLGCIAQGPTTADALASTPDAIRAYRRFLRRHGEAVEPDAPLTTVIVQHVMEGSWLGNGDPTSGFPPDFQALSTDKVATYRKRLEWLFADLARVISKLQREDLLAEPAGGGRPIGRIVEHVSEAQGAYLRYTTGKVDGLAEALRAVRESPQDLASALTRVWQISDLRLGAMTSEELERQVQHGQVTWTAHRGMRRMLEHAWEHLSEISNRQNNERQIKKWTLE